MMADTGSRAAAQLPLALQLRERRDFASFVDRGNEALVALLRKLAAGAAGPLFLRGESGSGRTHLLEATLQEVLARGGSGVLLPGHELQALSPSVLEGLEHQDLVAIDDLDALAGRRDWEEALFHLYNRCLGRGCAWVAAAAEGPRHLGLTLADLASRLGAGGVYQVRGLDEAGLLSLVQQRARTRGLALEPEVAEYIIRRHPRSPAALCATLERLDREALARKRRLTVPLVREVLDW